MRHRTSPIPGPDLIDAETRRVTSLDGTEITGRVIGGGPPLVLLPAGPGDCETTWIPALPFLKERFSCHLLNTRGRGMSADHPDHSPERLEGDIRAYVDAIGEPVCMAEWGSFVGASLALAVARDSAPVTAVGTYDPLPIGIADEADTDRLNGTFARLGELAAEGRLDDAARFFVEALARHGYYTPEDMADGATTEFWTASAPNIPLFLRELEQAGTYGGADPSEPSELAKTTVPVLVLHGGRSHPMNVRFAHHVASHVGAPAIREVEGAGHYGPHTHPQAVAVELTRFFQGVEVCGPGSWSSHEHSSEKASQDSHEEPKKLRQEGEKNGLEKPAKQGHGRPGHG